MTHRWLYLATPLLVVALLLQLACGDDDDGGPPPEEPKDASSVDATIADATLDSTIDSTVADTGNDSADANVLDVVDAGPLCTVAPAPIGGTDAAPSYYSLSINLDGPTSTCVVTPTTNPEDEAVGIYVQFDPGSSTYLVRMGLSWNLVSVSSGLVAGTEVTGLVPSTVVTLKASRLPDAGAGEAGSDAGPALTRTLKFVMNANQNADAGADADADAATDSSKWTFSLLAFDPG